MTERIIRLKGPIRAYLVTRYPFPKPSVWRAFVAWSGKQHEAHRFKSAKQAYACLNELKDYTYGKDSEVVKLVKRSHH